MTAMEMVAPFVGAATLELVQWYQLRDRLTLPKYRKMLRSVGYWAITIAMAIGGGAGTLIYFDGKLTQGELLVAGAAFPTLFKKLIGGFVKDHGQVKLGADRERDADSAQNGSDSGAKAYFTV